MSPASIAVSAIAPSASHADDAIGRSLAVDAKTTDLGCEAVRPAASPDWPLVTRSRESRTPTFIPRTGE